MDNVKVGRGCGGKWGVVTCISTTYAVHLMAGIMRSGRSHPLRCIKDILTGKYLQGPRIVREPYYWFGYQSILLLYAIFMAGDPSRHSV